MINILYIINNIFLQKNNSVDKNINTLYPYKYKLYKKYMSEKIGDNKRERFKKLAVYRTNEVLKRLKVLGNCGNRSAYDYSEDEIIKIFTEIDHSIKETKAKFHFPKRNKEFKL